MKKKFTVKIPEHYDADDTRRLILALSDYGATDITGNEGVVIGKITKQSRDTILGELNNRGLSHNIKPKRTFWKQENDMGEMEIRDDRIVEAILGIIAIFIFPRMITTKLMDYYWFQQFGLENIVFMKNFTTFMYMFVAIFIIMTVVSQINWKIMKGWFQKTYDSKPDEVSLYYHIGTVIVSLILSFVITAFNWMSWLRYVNRVPFGETDPIFGNDIGFYVFELPFIKSVLFWSLAFTIVLLIIDILICSLEDEDIAWREKIPLNMRLLTTLAIFIIATFMFLRKYNLLYSNFGVVTGIGYTEMHIWIPAYWIIGLVITLLGIALLFFPLLEKPSEKEGFGVGLAAILVIVILIVGLLLTGIVGLAYQDLATKPTELDKERPYLGYNIKMTREAYGLDNMKERFYPVATNLDLSILNSPTIENTRIFDYNPLLKFLYQKHGLRTYYDIHDVDVDRYTINGEPTEVLIAPREMNQDLLSRKTWINEHFVYTHGKGVTVNPVGITDSEGNPVMFVEKIPPVSTVPELEITQSSIYYGQMTNGMIFTNTNQQEFDYPLGESDSVAHTIYNGTGGIEFSTPLRKFVVAWRNSFLGIKIYQANLTSDSRIHIVRNIDDRVEKIVPYLYFDKDPYIVIDDGRLIWMMSGMAYTKKYPYSPGSSINEFTSFNYIRDSVKVVFDAENGNPTFYLINEDPIMQVYQKIYPGLFRPISEMPESQKDHLKYPEDLLTYQTKVLSVYQMNNTDIFYNKEDVWKIAREIHGLEETQEVEAYNVMLEIENKTEFMLMLPLTPLKKANMVAWFSVQQDAPNYGDLILYRFPRDAITLGPMQVENLIDEDEDISRDMSLWNTGGSSVIRGNLLVIPIRESLLYIEPVFIVADREDSMPELKRVIVVYNGKIAMTESLEESIRQVIDPEETIVIGGKEKKLTDIEITMETDEAAMIIIVYDEDRKEIGRFPIQGNHTFSVIPQ